MAKSQQTFNKLEREKNKAKKREEKRKKMQARKEARERGELKQDEFVYVDHLGNFTDTPPDPAEKEEISLESINLGAAKNQDFDEIDLYKREIKKMTSKFSLTDVVEIVHKFTKIILRKDLVLLKTYHLMIPIFFILVNVKTH